MEVFHAPHIHGRGGGGGGDPGAPATGRASSCATSAPAAAVSRSAAPGRRTSRWRLHLAPELLSSSQTQSGASARPHSRLRPDHAPMSHVAGACRRAARESDRARSLTRAAGKRVEESAALCPAPSAAVQTARRPEPQSRRPPHALLAPEGTMPKRKRRQPRRARAAARRRPGAAARPRARRRRRPGWPPAQTPGRSTGGRAAPRGSPVRRSSPGWLPAPSAGRRGHCRLSRAQRERRADVLIPAARKHAGTTRTLLTHRHGSCPGRAAALGASF